MTELATCVKNEREKYTRKNVQSTMVKSTIHLFHTCHTGDNKACEQFSIYNTMIKNTD